MLTLLNKAYYLVSTTFRYFSNHSHTAHAPVDSAHLKMFVSEVTDCILVFCLIKFIQHF